MRKPIIFNGKKIKLLFRWNFQICLYGRWYKQKPDDKCKIAPKSHFKPEKVEILEDDEILRIEELADKRNKSWNPIYLYGYLIVFLIHTGLRRGELFALKWEDVDLENRVVNVNKSMVRIRIEV